jgi:hypothetical protein
MSDDTQTGDALDNAVAAAQEADLRRATRIQIEETVAHNAATTAKNINSLSDAEFRRHVLQTYGFFPGV